MEDFVCPYCGALLGDEYEECPYCGRVLKEKNEQPKSGAYFDPTIRGNKSDEWILKWKKRQIKHNHYTSGACVSREGPTYTATHSSKYYH